MLIVFRLISNNGNSGCTSITALPKGLKVGGGLYLSGCTGLNLPGNLKVGGAIYTKWKKMEGFDIF